jgi:hypothetical protein
MEKDDLFNELRNHLGVLVVKQQRLEKECELLRKDNINLNKQLKDKAIKIEHFNSQQNLSNIATSVVGKESDIGALKRQINEYIREIDRCIVHLQQ